jgi:hypothetical protein
VIISKMKHKANCGFLCKQSWCFCVNKCQSWLIIPFNVRHMTSQIERNMPETLSESKMVPALETKLWHCDTFVIESKAPSESHRPIPNST